MKVAKQPHQVFLLLALILTLLFPLPAKADPLGGLIKNGDALWMSWNHPFESYYWFVEKNRTSLELQHCNPQQYEGDDDTTAFWIASNHTLSDRMGSKPFLSEHRNFLLSLLTIGNKNSQDNLNMASRMGTYGLNYTLFFHHFTRDESSLVCARLDGASNLLYGVSWLLNMPQKFVGQAAFHLNPTPTDSKPIFLVDLLIWLFIIFPLDFIVCFFATIFGSLIGCILHPINTLCSTLGLLYFVLPTLWTSVANFVVNTVSLIVSIVKLAILAIPH